MGLFSKTPWWKDKKNGWPRHGVRDFFRESEAYAKNGQIGKAIEVLEWGIRFSRESGSGGGVNQMEEMIETLRQHL